MLVTQLCNKRRQKKAKSKFTKISEFHYAIISAVKHKWYHVNRLTKRFQLSGHTKNYRILFTNSKVRDKLHFTLRVKKRLKKCYWNPISKVKVKSLFRVVHAYLVPQYNQTCIMTILVLLHVANNNYSTAS